MTGLQERIQLLISTKGMTNAEFAEKIGVHPSIISHISSGRNKPSLDIVDKISETFKEVRLEWLMKGKGAMTSGEYNLFENLEDSVVSKPEVKTTDSTAKSQPIVQKSIPAQPESLNSIKKTEETTDYEEDKPKSDWSKNDVRKNEKKYPHKTPQKSVERIVIFYEDKTFSEYFPED